MKTQYPLSTRDDRLADSPLSSHCERWRLGPQRRDEDISAARLGRAILDCERTGCPPPQATQTLAPSAQIDKPLSPSKLLLIRRFLRAIGLQQQLDSGSFLERYAIPGGLMWQVSSGQAVPESLKGFEKRMTALTNAYAKHRAEYQQAYEDHVNWEFTDAELAEIVGFLERPVGKHFLDGRWRMEAYVGTDTEQLEEQIVKEAMASLTK